MSVPFELIISSSLFINALTILLTILGVLSLTLMSVLNVIFTVYRGWSQKLQTFRLPFILSKFSVISIFNIIAIL